MPHTAEQKRALRKANPEKARRYYAENKEKCIAATRKWHAENRDLANEKRRAWKAANKQRLAEQRHAYYKANTEQYRRHGKLYRARHPDACRAKENARRAAQLQALPRWTNDEDRAYVRLIYAEARHRRLSVDHIVPLQGKNVCGLHVYWNMQLLPRVENARKGNRL